MCENLRYHYRDFVLRAHQCHKGKDSGEVGLERKENRQMYRLQDAMREERGHTQTKRQSVRKPRRQRRQDRGEQEKTRKQKEAEIVKTMRETQKEGRDSSLANAGPASVPAAWFLHPSCVPTKPLWILTIIPSQLFELAWISFLFLVTKTKK